ncbi:MAG TPA: amidase family protein [Candidatus Thermoplasmatota archaeon]|nr:amidase family protein [Candidatus Thermoplasmatota archaeon]
MLPKVPAAAFLALLALGGCAALKTDPPANPLVGSVVPTDCLGGVGGLDLQRATIADLQKALTAGTVTSVQLVDAYAARIAAFDSVTGPGPKLNSVQEVSATARAQALALDQERAAGRVRGPLHGIPILLKDNIGTMDEPTTAGSIALANNVPPLDATLTARLREAGMVILGKTHLSEFANWMATGMPNGFSSLGGQVHNAYTGGDPSGSSSGSGVAGSMAFAAITIGTETSGSILGPSDANSLVGVKPTTGLVSRAGVIPLAGNFDTPGPMGRNVADAAAVLGALAGTDAKDPLTAAADAHLPPGHDYVAGLAVDALDGVRIGYDSGPKGAIFLRALANLTAAGATLVPIDMNDYPDPGALELAVIFNEFKQNLNDYLAHQAGPGSPVTDLTGIIVYNQQHQDRIPYGQDHLIESDAMPGDPVTATYAATPIVLGNRVVADKLFADNGIQAIVGPGLDFVSMGAAAGYPTVIVPAGYNGNDPQGLSFFGPAWSEAKLLSYAYAYEQQSHARVPPTTITETLLKGVCT